MEILAVPVVRTAPAVRFDGFDVVGYVDFLLTMLLEGAPGQLIARWQEENGFARCVLQRRGAAGVDLILGEVANLGLFRSLLARFGYAYLDTQLYGGTRSVVLEQENRRCPCTFRMGNQGSSGFWLQVQADLPTVGF